MTTPWILLADGTRHHLAGYDMAHNTYRVPTLAHHIAQINRYTGAARRPYSVAEHSLLCADIAHDAGLPTAVQLACLVHDLHEAITGGVGSPLKAALGEAWHHIEATHERALRRALGLQSIFAGHRSTIKTIDLIALATERRDLMPWSIDASDPWPVLDTPGQRIAPHEQASLTTPWREQRHWTEWRDAFIERYNALRSALVRQHERNVVEAMEP